MSNGLASSCSISLLGIVSGGLYFEAAQGFAADPLSEPCGLNELADGLDVLGAAWSVCAAANPRPEPSFNACLAIEVAKNFLEVFRAPLGLVIRFHRLPRKLRKGRKDKKQFKLNLHFVGERQRFMYNKRTWGLLFLRDFGPVFSLTFPEGIKAKKMIFLVDTLSVHSAAAEAAPQKIRHFQLTMWEFFMEHGLAMASAKKKK